MQTCFVVLEPVNHVYKVIETAAARGLHVVVFHAAPLAVGGGYTKGFDAIGEFHRIGSWLDEEAALQSIHSHLDGRAVSGTYAAVETVLLVEATLREQLGLPSHGRAAIERLLDKRWVRRRLRETGLSRLGDANPREVTAGATWPFEDRTAYLKPITGGGSVHVTKCAGLEDVARGLREWDEEALSCRPILRQHLRRGGDLFLEEEAKGELMSLEGWVQDGRYRALGLTSRTVLARDPSVEMGATFPYDHPLRADIESKIGAIHAALGLVHGMTHAELMVSREGVVELVELNVRFGGSDILLMMNHAFGAAVDELLVDVACGREPARVDFICKGYACMQQLLAPPGTAVLEGIDLDRGLVLNSRLLKDAGSVLASTNYQGDHVATFMVYGDSYAEALENARKVRSGARVNGTWIGEDCNNDVVLR
ncbi:ATP-grasp domain-containing protein (plasmid) [Massilia forsythiae]|uniref:ATP-grasp domain-containing protein n=1 Tax=Massilia forsythiae TaxID=2728020 RepID=A0A7Z2W2G9_9BURK|nr:ATP-grasp domain-containing protein [Massilia forsythiae]QJE03664.1 ATP-grasp domain-containing protein [Massilia forsythiae]